MVNELSYFKRSGGEPDLVVYYYMNDSSDGIVIQVLEL